MDIFHTEGIILNTLPFQDYDQILTVFSPEGLMKFIIKKAYLSRKGKSQAGSPLTKAEFTYTKRKSELFLCQEIDILNQYIALRQDINKLEASCDMLQTTLISQWPGKPAPNLYRLLTIYLEKMPQVLDPFIISSSFRLKTLRLEGLLKIEPVCTTCQKPLTETFWTAGESFCSTHAFPSAIVLSEEEIQLLQHLTFCDHFSQLTTLTLPSSLTSKVKCLCQELFHSG